MDHPYEWSDDQQQQQITFFTKPELKSSHQNNNKNLPSRTVAATCNRQSYQACFKDCINPGEKQFD